MSRRWLLVVAILIVGMWMGARVVRAACTGEVKCAFDDDFGACDFTSDQYYVRACNDSCGSGTCDPPECEISTTCDTVGGGGTLLCADATQPTCSLGACSGRE